MLKLSCWQYIATERRVPTGNGEANFLIYLGQIFVDGQRIEVPVFVGQLPEKDRVILGYQAFELFYITLDNKQDLATLEVK
ncbi:hypothetical protein ACL6C3_13915 [Capilliphycus salinus ALCB114379]|uniref:hypothetical protein n=1 Tax=Capilliphycus salinus TaxID=2768948 RepID=UPI0039A4965D